MNSCICNNDDLQRRCNWTPASNFQSFQGRWMVKPWTHGSVASPRILRRVLIWRRRLNFRLQVCNWRALLRHVGTLNWNVLHRWSSWVQQRIWILHLLILGMLSAKHRRIAFLLQGINRIFLFASCNLLCLPLLLCHTLVHITPHLVTPITFHLTQVFISCIWTFFFLRPEREITVPSTNKNEINSLTHSFIHILALRSASPSGTF